MNEYSQTLNDSPEQAVIPINVDLKEGKPGFFGQALMEGQLKERSEGVQAQWQTALGVVMAAGS